LQSSSLPPQHFPARQGIEKIAKSRFLLGGIFLAFYDPQEGWTMILAIPIFGCEISPRFDCAREVMLFRVEGGKILDQWSLPIGEETDPLNRARILSAQKVQQIICSGIDDFSFRMLNGMGIQVLPWVSGDAQQALKGFLAGMGPGSDPQGR
jgi:predicted Fe-Mo cluster-binding NifX family protein